MIKKTVLVLSLLSLGACATIIEGSTDQINVTTTPTTNADCKLSNTRGTVTSTSPSTTAVKKSINDLTVSCADKHGAKGETVVQSEIEPWDFGNILLGGLIGMGIDWATGAAYNYPDKVLVPLTK